ncbi:hypothetical protein BATDEDRAFT_89666 [Batrachochytrium dendrobatidis JAM81]|uniref:Transcriptional activator HAP2 n=2 Tax=Batrachochytrium dendrobatidis TaxID=109871 RepID=F4P6E3_BATDJ|nr:transcription activator HAP2 [Batrachochytrium dendrobatidis JAM81]EGF79593.1 hypothetical protein BATDEDRAFT_89666 [Batrachochytrium dendrobatidis JAM81]KAK5665621.1 Transcriptional activator [Batrachochytrium dendrobatidis]OAJ42548.1 hypothetical protein BDEG_25997 [Batrachochytrium dendrobatidis JEL423]|eukprot:XP_006680217.1 hypothetical protein BATDEDRAFT_89666 [Batrachochytrium dendrobatidis JAM81]
MSSSHGQHSSNGQRVPHKQQPHYQQDPLQGYSISQSQLPYNYTQMVQGLNVNPQIIEHLAGLGSQPILGIQGMSAPASLVNSVSAAPATVSTPVVDTPSAPEEPLYVNAKQYHRILKRRDARSKWEMAHAAKQKEKGYIHESRHKHAMRRPRGPGGRFLSAQELAALEAVQGGVMGNPSTEAINAAVAAVAAATAAAKLRHSVEYPSHPNYQDNSNLHK